MADTKEQKTSYPKSKINILLMESVHQKAVDGFVKQGFHVETVHRLNEDQLVEKIANVHVIGVRSKTKLTRRVLEAAKKLLAVGCFCIGTDQTDLQYAAERGIPVFNAPFANTRSVAEMVVAEIVVLARKIGDRIRECHEGVWNKMSKGCYEVRGKSLGIIGYGHVGSQLSILAEALGMRVQYYDILNKLPLGNATPSESMDALLASSDFVSLHVPGTEETKNLIGPREIELMKPGSYLINAARGKVVDNDAAAAALRSGHLAGAAFDVYPQEPGSRDTPFESPLRNCPNTVLTPHIGGSTEEAQETIGIEVSGKLLDFINRGTTLDAVNFPELSLPPTKTEHRILNVHKNVPGVLRSINNILGDYNVSAQMLRTMNGIGYLIVELNSDVSIEVRNKIRSLETSIKTRILF